MSPNYTNLKNNPNCNLVIDLNENANFTVESLISAFESKNVRTKILAIQKLIVLCLNGIEVQRALIPLIKFCFSDSNKQIKRHCSIFWEVFAANYRLDAFPEQMLLLCNQLLRDLQQPNEYLRGSTLRLLCSLNEARIIENLSNSIKNALKDANCYVRKNAVIAVTILYSSYPDFFDDCCDIVYQILLTEKDEITEQNCFLMLSKHSREKALKFISSFTSETILKKNKFLLLAIIDFIRDEPIREETRLFFIKVLTALLSSKDKSVVSEASLLLLSKMSLKTPFKFLSSAVEGIFGEIKKSSDSNETMFFLQFLSKNLSRLRPILAKFTMEITRVFSVSNSEIKEYLLKILSEIITYDNKNYILKFLKENLTLIETNSSLRIILIDTLYNAARAFPKITEEVLSILLNDLNSRQTIDAKPLVKFMKEVSAKRIDLSEGIVLNLLKYLGGIKDSEILQSVFWIISDRIKGDSKLAKHCFDSILAVFESEKENSISSLIKLEENNYLAVYLATSLTKILLQTRSEQNLINLGNSEITDEKLFYADSAKLLKILTEMAMQKNITGSSRERISFCCHAILHPDLYGVYFLTASTKIESHFLNANKIEKSNDSCGVLNCIKAPLILNHSHEEIGPDFGLMADNCKKFEKIEKFDLDQINKDEKSVKQLTGIQDSIYVETKTSIDGHDAIIDFVLYNKTNNFLKSVTLDFLTTEFIEQDKDIDSIDIPPKESSHLKGRFKVTSSGGGVIFGDVIYFIKNKMHRIRIQSIKLNLAEFLLPKICATHEFVEFWAEYEWENKINLKSDKNCPKAFLKQLAASTKSYCLTPDSFLENDSGFLSANLFATSLFGENVLMNISIETEGEGIRGIARIRCEKEAIARSLGEKINLLCED